MMDYHLHTSLCGHARGRMEDYVKNAIQAGLEEIGFSGHFPLFHITDRKLASNLSIPEEKFPLYVEQVLDLRKKFPSIKIRLGCEVDYIPGYEEEIKKRLQPYSFDYVMGSVHFLDGFLFDHPDYIEEWEKRDVDEVYRNYFSRLLQCIETGLFDIIAHPDLVKKFGFFPKFSLGYLYQEIARALRKNNMVAEINTSGLRKPVQEIYPSLDFLKILRKYQVPITLGSDAHSPEEVGKDLDKAKEWAKEAGYKEYASFSGRKFRLLRFPSP
ncbi:MAG: histidinol-phosphatase HisJ [Caldiserica bacterium]|nr:histidinol-phosphatase HisJ [Caldisericota bacterium]